MQSKSRVEQTLSSSEIYDKFGLRTKETWPGTDYRSYFICKSLNMLLLLQGKSKTERGGCCPLRNIDRRMLFSSTNP